MTVEDERMVSNVESESRRNRCLAMLDFGIGEFLNLSASYAHDVIVVRALIQLENGIATLKITPCDEPGRFETGQDPVDGGQADVLMGLDQDPVDIVGGKVAQRAAFQNL
jgi:hypothetical protein